MTSSDCNPAIRRLEEQYGDSQPWELFIQATCCELWPYCDQPANTLRLARGSSSTHDAEQSYLADVIAGEHALWDVLDVYGYLRQRFAHDRADTATGTRKDQFRMNHGQGLIGQMPRTQIVDGKYQAMRAVLTRRAASVCEYQPQDGAPKFHLSVRMGSFIWHVLAGSSSEEKAAIYPGIKQELERLFDHLRQPHAYQAPSFVDDLAYFYWLMTNLQPMFGISGFLNDFLLPFFFHKNHLQVPALRTTFLDGSCDAIERARFDQAETMVDSQTRLVVDALTLAFSDFQAHFKTILAFALDPNIKADQAVVAIERWLLALPVTLALLTRAHPPTGTAGQGLERV